jgi:hypothetical protein
VADVVPGDRVVVSLMRSCGRCYFCERGDNHLCAGEFPATRGPDCTRRPESPWCRRCTQAPLRSGWSCTRPRWRRSRPPYPSTSPRFSDAVSSRAWARSSTGST